MDSSDSQATLLRAHDSVLDVLVGRPYFARIQGDKARLNPLVIASIQNPVALNNAREGIVRVKKISGSDVFVEFLKEAPFPIKKPVVESGRPGREAVVLSEVSVFRINALSKALLRKHVKLVGRIEKIQQTGGPTLFLLFDGSGTMNIKGFVGAGKRAFAEIESNMLVEAVVQLIEHEGVLEGEIRSIAVLSPSEKERVQVLLEMETQKRIEPVNRPFLIDSGVLEKLRPEFEKGVRLIKRAIVDNRPIVLKHHADADGYSAAIALERVILPLVLEQHGDEKAMWHYYVRTPSKSPYYDFYDATKDISMALSDVAKFNDKMPLVIIVDTGSGPENELPLQLVRVFGCPVMVVDHHHFESDPVSPIVDVHINPHFVGSSTDFSAGMLCVEIARMLSEKAENIEYIAALAGLADRIESKELDAYLAIAEKSGFSRQSLVELGTVIDFEAWNFKFSESRELVDILFGSDPEKQQQLVTMLYPKVREMMDRQLAISKQFVSVIPHAGMVLATIDIEASSLFGVYPPAGKATGNLHDWLKTSNPDKGVVTAGYGPDFLTLRATNNANFRVSEFVEKAIAAFPDTGIEGGGHEHAGSLKFIPGIRDKVLQKLQDYVVEKNA